MANEAIVIQKKPREHSCKLCKNIFLGWTFQIYCSATCRIEDYKEYNKEYKLENRDNQLKYNKEYYENNKDDLLSKSKVYKQNNPDKVKKWQDNCKLSGRKKVHDKIYYEKNKQKLYLKQIVYKRNNIVKIRLNRRIYDKKKRKNPIIRIQNNISRALHRVLKEKKYYQKWEDIVGFSAKDLINHLSKQFERGMTLENYGTYWNIDHRIPISWFNYTSIYDEEFKRCWSLQNLQPKLNIDNIKKSDKFAEPTLVQLRE